MGLTCLNCCLKQVYVRTYIPSDQDQKPLRLNLRSVLWMMNEKRGKIKRTKEQEARGHELKNQSFKKSTFVHTASSSIFFMSRFYWIYSFDFDLMSFKSWPEGENMDWCSLLDNAPSRNHVLGNHITGRGYWFQKSNGFLDWHWILKPLRKLDVLFRVLKSA